jgi:hypothetical protein
MARYQRERCRTGRGVLALHQTGLAPHRPTLAARNRLAARGSNLTYYILSARNEPEPGLARGPGLLDQTPIICPYFYDCLTAAQKNVTGVYPTAIGVLFLWNAAKS